MYIEDLFPISFKIHATCTLVMGSEAPTVCYNVVRGSSSTAIHVFHRKWIEWNPQWRLWFCTINFNIHWLQWEEEFVSEIKVMFAHITMGWITATCLQLKRLQFLASWDECMGRLCHSPTVCVGVRVHVSVGCVNKHFNLGNNFLTKSERVFILQMCIPCDKNFHMVP